MAGSSGGGQGLAGASGGLCGLNLNPGQVAQTPSLAGLQSLPTVDPKVVGAVWSNGGVLCVSAGP